MQCGHCRQIIETNYSSGYIISGIPFGTSGPAFTTGYQNNFIGVHSGRSKFFKSNKAISCRITTNDKEHEGSFCHWRCLIAWIDKLAPELVNLEIEEDICGSHSSGQTK